ncbi:MAG: nucleotide exchange factor GrpE [Porphyromonadaceae bacterium]|nr:nucleotide exchange factor GrpE [Porphyromonadaceae bacterium]
MNDEAKQVDLEELQEQLDANMTNEQERADSSEEMSVEADNSTATEEGLEQQFAKLNDTHLRLMAEYDNYRKRTLKEKSDLIRNGGEKVLRDLLPVIDDIDIALANIDTAEDMEAIKEGMRLIHSKFIDYLSRQGIKPIETEGANFNEELHEAIATFPAASDELKGKIIDCVKKGYTLNDKVLRHSSVVVGQ